MPKQYKRERVWQAGIETDGITVQTIEPVMALRQWSGTQQQDHDYETENHEKLFNGRLIAQSAIETCTSLLNWTSLYCNCMHHVCFLGQYYCGTN